MDYKKFYDVVPVSQELIPVSYFQRVWDITNSRWCYYTMTSVNPTPGTTDTSPVNSGSITGHSILSVTAG